MGKYKIGLDNILMGDIAEDGGMGTSLAPIGDTVIDSAKLETAEGTLTDFNIEESSQPVYSIKADGKTTISWSTYNNDVDNLVRLFGGTKVAGSAGAIDTLGTLTAGSGYTTDGTYTDVSLSGGTGSGAKGTITVVGGAVTLVTITSKGTGYTADDTLTTTASNIGGGGSGFSVKVATTADVGDRWNAPDTFPEVEQSLKIMIRSGGYMEIPRAKIAPKLTMSFGKSKLSQIDISATILKPNKEGVPIYSLING